MLEDLYFVAGLFAHLSHSSSPTILHLQQPTSPDLMYEDIENDDFDCCSDDDNFEDESLGGGGVRPVPEFAAASPAVDHNREPILHNGSLVDCSVTECPAQLNYVVQVSAAGGLKVLVNVSRARSSKAT